MEAIFFALVAHVGWGIGDILGAGSSRKIGGYSTIFWVSLVRIPLLAFYLPFDLEHVRALTFSNFALMSVLAIVGLAGSACFFEAFNSGNPSLVGTISAAFVVPVVVLSVLFLGETLDFYQTLSIVVITIGLIVTSLDFASIVQKRFVMDRGVFLALLSTLFLGIYFAFIRIPVQELGWFLPTYIGFFFTPLILIMMRLQGVKLRFPTAKGVLPAFVGALLLTTTGTFAYNLGISQGFTSIVAPIAGSYPVLFVCLSAFFFKEPLQKQQLLGVVISLIGIVALSFLS